MGGAFIDCNQLFCQLSHYTKQELCSLTIFNLTARQDLQKAFDQISQLISSPLTSRDQGEDETPILLQGAIRNRDDLGLSVSLIRGEDGILKCFCVTLIKNPALYGPMAKPIPVSFESITPRTTSHSVRKAPKSNLDAAPAFTAG